MVTIKTKYKAEVIQLTQNYVPKIELMSITLNPTVIF